MVFIDGSNLYYALKAEMGRASLDYEKFALALCGSTRRLVHTHYYNVPLRQATNPDAYRGQQRFYAQLQRAPHLSVHLGRLADRTRDEECPNCGHRYEVRFQAEKRVDVQLATHMLAHAFDDQYDTAVLVSQDGDFVPVVQEVRRLGKAVENAEFPSRLPSHLGSACSSVIRLESALLAPCMI